MKCSDLERLCRRFLLSVNRGNVIVILFFSERKCTILLFVVILGVAKSTRV